MASNMVFNLVGNDKSASKSIGGVQGKLGGLQKTLKKVAVIAAGAFAIKGAVNFGKDLITAGEAAATSDSRIQAISKSMGIWGGESDKVAKRLVDLANATAMNTGEDQNAIKMSQAKLLTFKEIANSAGEMGGIFDRATKATIDLAAAGFGTTADNAVQLGKALNDPIAGISALTRSGVTFTKAEKEQIKAMVEAGDVASAQEMILKSIESQVGGTSEATRNATDRMKVGWSVLMEQMGTAVLPGFNAVADVILDKVFPAASKLIDWFTGIATPAISDVISILFKGDYTGGLAEAFGLAEDSAFIDFLFNVREAAMGMFDSFDLSMFAPLVDGFKALFESVGPLLPQIMEAATAFNPLHLVFKAIAPLLPEIAGLFVDLITRALALVGPLIAQIVPLVSQLAAMFVGALGKAFAQLLPLVGYLIETFMSMMPVILSLVPAVLSIVTALMPLVGVVLSLITSLLPPLIEIFKALLTPILDLLPPLVESLAPILLTVATIIKDVLVPVVKWLADMFGGLVKALAPVIATIVGGLVKALGSVIKWLASVAAGIARFVSGAVAKFSEWSAKIRGYVDTFVSFFTGLPTRIGNAVSGMWDGIKDSFKAAVNWIIRKWNDFSLTIGGGTVLGVKMPSVTLDTPNIPYLAKGGILTGPTLFMGGEGSEPEAVTPLSKLGEFMRDYTATGYGGSGRQSIVLQNVTLKVVDTDGKLMGTMRTAAHEVVELHDEDRVTVLSSGPR